MSEPQITRQLASFVVNLNFHKLPSEVVQRAKDCVLDQLGVELLGSTLEWNKIVYEYAKTLGSKGKSTIVSYGDKTSPQDAAFVNSTFGQGCELDDAAFGSAGHPTAVTLPVVLALGERDRLNGKSLITAMVGGWDVMYRIMSAIHPHASKRGFQSQGIAGPFAAAAAAGKLLDLNEEEMVNALGIAGSHSAGPMEYDQSGGDVKRMHSGLAARAGIQSAVLARMGLTGPHTIIEGKRGFCRIFSDYQNMDLITENLGEDFKIMSVYFKVHPCVGRIQASIDAMATIVEQERINIHEVQEIEVGLSETSILHGGSILEPHDVASAQFSLAFSLGLRLLRNSNDLRDYMDRSLWTHPDIVNIAKRIKLYPDPEAVGDKLLSGRIRIRLMDGREVSAYQPYPKGSPKVEITKGELRTKFLRLTRDVIDSAQAESIIETIDKLEKLKNVRSLIKLLVVKPC